MRQTAARLNRTWLTLIGLLLLLVGAGALLLGTGLLESLVSSAGRTLTQPSSSDRVVSSSVASALTSSGAAIAAAIVGVLLALLAAAWLWAQIPRTNQAKPFRLYDDPMTGLTRCAPGVLTDAVEAQVKALPDVLNASALLRGSATEPDLDLKVTVSENVDLPKLLATIGHGVAADLGGALDTELRRLGVQVEIGKISTRNKTHKITLDARRDTLETVES